MDTAMTDIEARSQRTSSQDPGKESNARRIIEHARLKGSEVYLQALSDVQLWNDLPWEIRDLANAVVSKRLGSSFAFAGNTIFSCNGQSNAISSFIHKKLNARALLIPGRKAAICSVCSGEGFFHESYMECPFCIGSGRRSSLKPFIISQYPVSIDQWSKSCGKSMPKTNVYISEMLDWLAAYGLRLPTECEWVYSCSGGSETPYYWGFRVRRSYVWYKNNSGGRVRLNKYHHRKTNSFGLVDVLGNVWEAVQGLGLQARGGSYRSNRHDIQISSRRTLTSGSISGDLGFRFALTI